MKKISYLAAGALCISLFASSCNNSDNPDTDISLKNEVNSMTSADTTLSIGPTDTATLISGDEMAKIVSQSSTPAMPTGVGVAPTPPPATSANKGVLNPEHGQPGHRCDIPVGAPLNSPAQPSAKPATVPAAPAKPAFTANPAMPSGTAPATATAPGMNPPHGQPGHRCEIAVGAPLNGSAATPAPSAPPVAIPDFIKPAQPATLTPPPLPEAKKGE